MTLRLLRPLLLTLSVSLAATACGTRDASETTPGGSDPTGSDTSSAAADRATRATEAASATPRLALTYDGGVMVVDVTDGSVLLDEELPGFLRVAAAGDDRHVLVAGEGGWRALDLGSWGHDHGDHAHHYAGDARLTDVRFPAEEPGHVVSHHGHTTLFDDGTGDITVLDPHELEDGAPEVETLTAGDAHHGVAAQLADRNLLHTVGTEEARSGVRLVSPAGIELAATDECPGVHGEAVAMDRAVFGCEDGVVVVDGRDMTKVQSPDGYGRVGNQAGSDVSPVVLGDYKVDADAEIERPERVSLIDTERGSMRLVDLGTSYTFKSLGRGPDGEALVLGTDGRLHVIDPVSGRVTDRIEVVEPWREPMDWQQARPALHVADGTAYVTEPATDSVHVVDLDAGTVSETIDLPHTPVELVANVG